jgi:hypothetical protein
MKTRLLAALAPVLLAGCAWFEETPERPDYNALFNQPLVTPGAQFALLPPAVQQTIRAQGGTQEISNIIKDTRGGHVVYRIEFRNYALLPPLYVAQDGSVLNPDLTVAIAAPRNLIGVVSDSGGNAVTLADLPIEVINTIRDRAPHAEIASITRESYGVQTAYVVIFKDPRVPSLRISAQGAVIFE